MRKKSTGFKKNDLARFVYLRADVLLFLFACYVKIVAFSLLAGIPVTPLAATLSLTGLLIVAFLFTLTGDTIFRMVRVLFWDFLFSFMIVSDLVYSRYFGDVVTWPALSGALQLNAVRSSVKALFEPSDLLFFADIFLIAMLLILRIRRVRKKRSGLKLSPYRRLRKNLFRITLAVLLAVFLLSGWAVYFQSPKLFDAFTENQQGEFPVNSSYVASMGILNFHVFDTGLFLKKLLLKPNATKKQIEEAQAWFDWRPPFRKNDFWGIARGKNIIILLVESLQGFVIDLEVEGQPVTPNLNAWARESFYFRNFFHQTAQGRTIDAEFVSVASLYPLRAGAVSLLYPEHEYDSLPKALRRHQYFTALAQAYKKDFWNEDALSRALGFERHITEEDFRIDEVIAMGLSDTRYLDQMREKLEKFQQPFFATVVTLSSHHPYDELPQKYRKLKLGKWEGTLMGDYLQSAHYSDEALGGFLDQFRESGLYEKTVLVILGDHDAGLKKKELAEISGVEPTAFNLKMLDKVPLIIHIPGTGKAPASGKIGGTIDLAPTLLYLLGIETGGDYFMGSNLFDEEHSDPVIFRNGSALSDRFLYLQPAHSKSGGCYDLSAGGRLEWKTANPFAARGGGGSISRTSSSNQYDQKTPA